MKQKLLLKGFIMAAFIVCSITTVKAIGIVKYVKTAANGGSNSANGNSWATAYATIDHAIFMMNNTNNTAFDTIYMGSGTYTATGESNANSGNNNSSGIKGAIVLPVNVYVQGSWGGTNNSVYDPVNTATTFDFSNLAPAAPLGRSGFVTASANTGVGQIANLNLTGLKIINAPSGGATVDLTNDPNTDGGPQNGVKITLRDITFINDGQPFALTDNVGNPTVENANITINNTLVNTYSTIGINSETVTITNSTFNNTANSGLLAVYCGSKANNTLNISGSSFCNATDNAVNLQGVTSTITNSTFRNNSSGSNTNSLHTGPNTATTLTGVTFYLNKISGSETTAGADLNGQDNTATFSIQSSYMQLASKNAYTSSGLGNYTFVGTGNTFNNTQANASHNDPGTCLSSIQQSQILPVTGLTLTAQLISGNPQLNWQTLTESNTSYFAVQSSGDGSSFTTIGKVTAAGNSNAALNYTFTDNAATGSVVYYRIQTVDKDGAVTISNIVAVRLTDAAAGYKVYPNPATNLVNIETGVAGNYLVELLTSDGRKVQAANISSSSGLISFNINRGSIAAGVYVVKTTNIKAGSSNYSTILVR